MRHRILILLTVVGLASVAPAQKTSPEQRASHYFESARKQPSLLLAFLRDMPKGGDLHNHLSGAIYAESFIDYAAEDGLCVDRTTAQIIKGPCEPCENYTNKPAVKCAYGDHVLYNSMVDAYSMRSWNRDEESGHDHFFTTFDKFGPASHGRTADMIAEAASRASADHVQYLELMHTADGPHALTLGAKMGWDDDLAKLRSLLLESGLQEMVEATRQTVDFEEKHVRELLRCDSGDPDPGCKVTVRYLYQVLRGLPKEQVFAQILLGFELAKADPRFVGLNLVMPEDWYVPMHDFPLHMKMLGFLHEIYPDVHISLHAGELALGLVPPEGLRFHIRDSIEKGHAERIGHGVDVMQENDPIELLQEMAKANVLVEVCLTSNEMILGVRGAEHPLPMYLKYGVPVALATDDEGVSRSNMTQEWKRAAETYGLTYADLKKLARNSLEHNFLPGKSLWIDANTFKRVAACAADSPAAEKPSAACGKFLDGSEKAKAQWDLERSYAAFETKF
jgi:adenosine deaminase